MKKYGLVLFLAAVFCIGLMSSSQAAKTEYRQVVIKEKGFSVSFPSTWDVNKGQGKTVITATSPLKGAEDTFQETVNILIEPLDMDYTLDQYYEVNVARTKGKGGLPGFTEISRKKITINDVPAIRMVYASRPDKKGRNVAYIMLRNKKAYVMVGSSMTNGFAECEPIFDEIARSIRIR